MTVMNLCFVKDTYVDGKKLAKNGPKMEDSLLKDAVLSVQVSFPLSTYYFLSALCIIYFTHYDTPFIDFIFKK